jgi:hypothetical protein
MLWASFRLSLTTEWRIPPCQVGLSENARIAESAGKVDSADQNSRLLLSFTVSSTPSDASRPPYDLKAEKPEDAYQLDEVIPPNDLTEMDVSDLMRVTATDLKSTLVAYGIVEHSLIYARLEKELNKPAKQRSTDRVKRMVYVALMIQFFSVLSGPYKAYQDPTALAGRMGGISLSIAQSLLNRFAMQKSQEAGKTSYGTTSQLRDKLACYIIIACLSLDNYEFDINSLAKDLKQSNKKWVPFLCFELPATDVPRPSSQNNRFGQVCRVQDGEDVCCGCEECWNRRPAGQGSPICTVDVSPALSWCNAAMRTSGRIYESQPHSFSSPSPSPSRAEAPFVAFCGDTLSFCSSAGAFGDSAGSVSAGGSSPQPFFS